MDLKKIKLIIWDLDETLWKGTLSEENVYLNQHLVDFINNTLDIGIVHSICSKNDFKKTKEKLEELNIWDLFVFPSIDWTPKGTRIKTIINNMNLRAANVLFVDDNIQNLEEAKYYCDEIMVSLPDKMEPLIVQSKLEEKTDLAHKRLKQYKILQKKETEKSNYSSNLDFLNSCGICVEIHNDCIENIDRIHELLMRSNQLNYTKFRQEKNDLEKLLLDENVNAGYVKVHDNFGDYGIVGFFAIKNNKAVHYLFSCRTLGMLVEQYVYIKIGCPEINVVGEVVTQLDNKTIPEWINNKKIVKGDFEQKKISKRILLKGPCDMEQMFSFIKQNDNIITEFTYINASGVKIEGHNHTGQVLTSLLCSEKRKNEIIGEFDWFDKDMLTTKLDNDNLEVVVYSLLNDGNLGLYKRKDDEKILISLCERIYDLTNPANRELYINKKIPTSNIDFTLNDLERFAEYYEYVPNDGSVTVDNLDKIYPYIKANKFIIILGSEIEFENPCMPNYKDRHIFHKQINSMVRAWAKNKDNIILLPLDKYILSKSDFADTINHLSKSAYYRLAEDLISIIGDGDNIKLSGKGTLIYHTLRQKFRLLKNKFL